MATKKSEPMVQKKPAKKQTSKKEVGLAYTATSIVAVGEMPGQSDMKEGKLYVSFKDTPQVRMKVQGKIIKFKLEA